MTVVAVNDFVRRQVKGSGKTYSPDLSFEEIAHHAEEQYGKGEYEMGYRDGVIIVNAASWLVHHFICPYVEIDEQTRLKAEITQRSPEEEPYIRIRALSGEPVPAQQVQLILYRHDVLAENDEFSSNAKWELISIHAIPKGIKTLPMGPVTMMRNQLELPGGTKARYSSEEWAQSVRFWQRYAALEPEV